MAVGWWRGGCYHLVSWWLYEDARSKWVPPESRRPTLASDRHYGFVKNPLTTQSQSLKDIWDAH